MQVCSSVQLQNTSWLVALNRKTAALEGKVRVQWDVSKKGSTAGTNTHSFFVKYK